MKKKGSVLLALSMLTILLLANAFRGMEQTEQRYLCIYSLREGLLIDFFEGKNRFTIAEGVAKKQEDFAAKGNRWAHGISHQHGDGISPGRDSTTGNFHLKNGLVQYGALSIGFSNFKNTGNNYNIFLLQKNCTTEIDTCFNNPNLKIVIADATSSRKQSARWKSACEAHGITFYDIRENGAWEKIE